MASSDVRPELPAVGEWFVGRAHLVRNLLSRCLHRQSLVLYGGPKLGKTSMLRQLQWLAERDSPSRPALPPVVYVDLAQPRAREELLDGRWSHPAPIVLLDHPERILEETDGPRAAAHLLERLPLAYAVVSAGGPLWLQWVREQRTTERRRPVPLAVLFEGEARALLSRYVDDPEQIRAAMGAGGTHPYVLKVLAAALQAEPGDPPRAIRSAAARLIPFFQAWADAVRRDEEQALLTLLVDEARTVAPADAARRLNRPTLKGAADALCALGLIRRWNLSEGAMLEAHCRLFNDWFQTRGCSRAG